MSTFGEEIKVFPQKGGVYKIRGIFDNEYQSVDPNTEQVISANQPALGINLNDVAVDIRANDIIELRGMKFRVIDKREDGQGGATLHLHKVKLSERIQDTRASKA